MTGSNHDGRRSWWSRWIDDVDRRAWVEGRNLKVAEMKKNARKEEELAMKGEL